MRKDADWIWNHDHENTFLKSNEEIKRWYNCHILKKQEIRIIFDASKQGVGAVLQQSQKNGEWKPICFATRFLSDVEAMYSITELEILAIVLAIDHFKNWYMVYYLKYFQITKP